MGYLSAQSVRNGSGASRSVSYNFEFLKKTDFLWPNRATDSTGIGLFGMDFHRPYSDNMETLGFGEVSWAIVCGEYLVVRARLFDSRLGRPVAVHFWCARVSQGIGSGFVYAQDTSQGVAQRVLGDVKASAALWIGDGLFERAECQKWLGRVEECVVQL